MRKLLLVNPVGRKSGYLLSTFSTFPPLNLAYVAAVTPETWEVSLLDENFTPFEYQQADLVGITAFTSSIGRAYEIAEICRSKGTKVVIGGIHASMVSEEVSRFTDSVIIGEAEEIWPQVLEDFEKGDLKAIYSAPRLTFAEKTIHPRRDILDPRYFWSSIQTSRGCPFACSFCSVSAYLGKEFRQRDVEDILDELSEIKGKFIVFTDDNLIGYSKESRERARLLFQGMIDRKLNKRWWMQTSINASDNEDILSLAARAGCMFALIGFEAVKEETLRSMKKGINIIKGPDNYKKVVRTFHKYRIAVIGAFIIGTDNESFAYYRSFARFLLHSGMDMCQLSILTPLPGTDFFKQMKKEGRLTHTDFPGDWVDYRMSRVVHLLKGGTPETVYRGDNFIKRRIYSPLPFIYRMVRSLFSLRSFRNFLSVLMMNLAFKKSWKNSYYFKNYPSKFLRGE